MGEFKRITLLSSGFICVALGVIGMFMPVMPSIPFFIIASICFSKSSEKFHNILLNNKIVGPHIKRYHENNGISVKSKILLIIVQWGGVVFTSILFVHSFIGRILLVAIAVGATIYILSLKTAKKIAG